MLKTPEPKPESKQVIGIDEMRIRGKTHKIREVWYSVLNPEEPPVVYVAYAEGEDKPTC